MSSGVGSMTGFGSSEGTSTASGRDVSGFIASVGSVGAGGAVDVSEGIVDLARSIASDRDAVASVQPTAVSKANTTGMVTLRLMFMGPPAT